MTIEQEFPPTLREVMLRGRWLGVLVVCLIVAGVFAFLGQWQLERAIDSDPLPAGATEEVRPLAEVVQPGEYLPAPLVGQRVESTGEWIADDFLVVASRYNEGVQGYWVTGQLRVAEGTSIAVALGWAPDAAAAATAAERINSELAGTQARVVGRIISDEGPIPPPQNDPYRMERMSPAALLSQWHDTAELSVYRPFLTAMDAPAPLANIFSPAPEETSPVNWLNIFYAAEWAVFSGCAFYLWYRLAKDAWEREVEDFEDAQLAA